MDFLPLSIWATGVISLMVWEEQNKYKRGYTKKEIRDEDDSASIQIYIGGICLFLFLGFVSMVQW